jgi:hypothetical protein
MAGFTLIADLMAAGQEFGVFEFYLPWIIMFAVFWAILAKIKIFGDPKQQGAKAINLIISLGASMYIMANTAIGINFATFLSALFGGTFMVILTIIAFVTVLYVVFRASLGKDPLKVGKGERNWWKYLMIFAALGAIVLVIGVYTSSSGTSLFPGLGLDLPGFELPSLTSGVGAGLPEINISTQDLAIIVLVALTGLIVFFVVWKGGDLEDAVEGQ